MSEYLFSLNYGLNHVNWAMLDKIVDVIKKEHLIAIIGNGGSASTAEHFACDLNNIGYRAIALTSGPTITALGNDFGFECIYSKQIENLKPNIIICISASGNSNDILAVTLNKTLPHKIISFTGFNGGMLKDMSDYNIHVPIKCYEIVEDIHLIICHMLKCKLKEK